MELPESVVDIEAILLKPRSTTPRTTEDYLRIALPNVVKEAKEKGITDLRIAEIDSTKLPTMIVMAIAGKLEGKVVVQKVKVEMGSQNKRLLTGTYVQASFVRPTEAPGATQHQFPISYDGLIAYDG